MNEWNEGAHCRPAALRPLSTSKLLADLAIDAPMYRTLDSPIYDERLTSQSLRISSSYGGDVGVLTAVAVSLHFVTLTSADCRRQG